MNTNQKTIDENSQVPLFGLDFLGILDRGTNVLEIKPITICNLHCQYCFVSAGDYTTNFIAEPSYLVKWIQKAIDLKQCNDIEIHFAPYGEILLYKPLLSVITRLKQIKQISKITMQTNGLLLTSEIIQKLSDAGVYRLNISLNSMDPSKCANYCGVKNYNLVHLLKMFDDVLKSSMQLLIAPVWFKNVNDQGIIDIIDYVKQKNTEGYVWPKLRLGIQNYLTYKTGRKIKKTRMKQFSYFYHLLHEMEQEHHLHLRLYPKDFGIDKTSPILAPVSQGDHANVTIIMKSRWNNEYIALLDENWAVKVITKVELEKGQKIRVKFIKSTLHGNLLTAVPH